MDTVLILIALASAFCFALALVLTQFGLRTTAPLTGAAIAVPTTALLFLVISPLTVGWDQWACSSATTFAVVGLFFPVAVTLLTFSANWRIGPNLTGTLGNLTPLFAVVLAIVLMGEAPNATQGLGIVAISAGVTLLFVGRGNGDARPALWTLGLPLSAAFLRGIAQPMVKWGMADWPSPFAAVTIGYMVSAVVMGGVILGRRDGGDHALDLIGAVVVGPRAGDRDRPCALERAEHLLSHREQGHRGAPVSTLCVMWVNAFGARTRLDVDFVDGPRQRRSMGTGVVQTG